MNATFYTFQGKKIGNIIIMFFFLLNSFCTIAQAPKFNIKLKLSITDGDLKGAVINITKNGSPYRVIDPSGGKYSVDLDLNAQYLFTCSKSGYISKSIVVDAQIPVGREQEDFAKFTASVTLNKQPDDQEITYSQPVGRIKYSKESGDFDYDTDYSATALEMQKKAEANPIPRPKAPTSNPQVTNTASTTSVDVKQPAHVPEPPKKKPIEAVPEIPSKPIVKNKTEKNYQRDRVKVTIITVNINGEDYEYLMEEYAWGATFYYKNGRNITMSCFNKEIE